MKNSSLIIVICILCSSIANSQTTSIPDVNFEQKLIDLGIDSDGIINGSVLTADISSILNLDLSLPSASSPNSIADLTGIEDFTALQILNVENNDINGSTTPLNLSQNIALTELNANSNSLITLDLSSNPLLEVLNVGSAAITTLDISQNTALRILIVDSNSNLASTLDVTNNIGLVELSCTNMGLTSLDVTNNTLLEIIRAGLNDLLSVDVTNNLNLKTLVLNSNSMITSIDVSQNIDLERLLVRNLNLNTIDISLNTNLIELSITNNNISNLNVTQNTLLNILICAQNPINSLDLSQNLILTQLSIGETNISSIDLSNNILLNSLNISQGNLSSIDLTSNSVLSILSANQTALGDLDLSNNVGLTSIQLFDAGLTSLNIKNGNNTNLVTLLALSNSMLSCIQVDDVIYATTNFNATVDSTVAFSLNCAARENALEEILEDSISPDGANNANAIAVTITQLMDIDELTGIESINELGYQETIAVETGFSNPPTLIQIQAIIDEVNTIATIVNDSNDPADGNPSITDLENVGIIGAQLSNEEAYEVAIANAIPAPNTLVKLQAIIDNVNSTLSIGSLDMETVIVYPNPSNYIIFIHGLNNLRLVTVYDFLGKKILVSKTSEINVSEFKPGMYLFNIETDQTTFIKRIIVK